MIFIINYLSATDVDAFLALDAKVYHGEYLVSKEATLMRISKNPYTDLIAKSNEGMIGYISLCPIENQFIRSIIHHSLTEEEIEERVIPFLHPGMYDAYLSSIVVDKEKFPHFPGSFFFRLLQKHIKILRKRGVFIRFIVAVAVSIGGRKILKKMRFSEIKPSVFLFNCVTHPSLFLSNDPIKTVKESNQQLRMIFNKWVFV